MTQATDQDEIFGRNVRVFRMKQGLTRAEFADEIGIPVSDLECLESGERPLTVGDLMSMSKKFQVSYKEIVGQ